MKAEVGRRGFVGTVLAGLPLVANQPGLLAQGGAMAHDHPTDPTTPDPVIDYLVRQMATIHNAARTGIRSEHLRGMATQLRTLAVYDRQIGLDAQVQQAVRDLVDRDGRNTVLYTDPDLETRQRHMRAYGFEPDDRQRNFTIAPTHAQREAALDRLLASGVTAELDRLASVAERAATRLDRSNRRLITIAQDDTDWWRGFCGELWQQYQDAQLLSSPFCLVAKQWAYLMPVCLAMEAGAMILLFTYIYDCM